MAKFTADRFTHQDTSEYGQGKKVTTKILETDAKNTEYLLGEVEKLQQYKGRIKTIIEAPPLIQTSTNIESAEIESYTEITDKTGTTYRLNPQTIYQFKGNNTNATLTTTPTELIETIKQIYAPVLQTGTTRVYKDVTSNITISYKLIGTIEGRNGITINTLLEDYKEHAEKDTSKFPENGFQTWSQVETFMAQNKFAFAYFSEYVNLKHQVHFYGYDLVFLPDFAEYNISARINENTPFYETTEHYGDDLILEQLLTNPGNSTDVLNIELDEILLKYITDNMLNFGEVYTKYVITEQASTYDILLTVVGNTRVYLNNTILVPGVDYQIRNSVLTVFNVSADDIVEVYTLPGKIRGKIKIVYKCYRDDTQSQMKILPITILYDDD